MCVNLNQSSIFMRAFKLLFVILLLPLTLFAHSTFEIRYSFLDATCTNQRNPSRSSQGVTGSPLVRVGLDCNDIEPDVFGYRAPTNLFAHRDRYIRAELDAGPGRVMVFDRPQTFFMSTYSSFSGAYYLDLAVFLNDGRDSLFIARYSLEPGGIQVMRFIPSIPETRRMELRIYPSFAPSSFQGWNGVYVMAIQGRTRSTVGITDEQTEIADGIRLLDAYPNPFNPVSTIPFEIPDTRPVTLKIYDVTGRLVATLAEGKTFGPGRHNIQFDASALASGAYLYTLDTVGYTSSKLFTLIK